MSRSKQLGGFPTSGVFGFRQTLVQAHAAVKPVYEVRTGRPAPSAFSTAALAAMSVSFHIIKAGASFVLRVTKHH